MRLTFPLPSPGWRTANGVRYLGPTDPPKGNCFEVHIQQHPNKPMILNACSYGIAMAFAERWNRRTNSDTASVQFIGEL